MKKLVLVLALIALVGFGAFAETVVEPTISGDATMTLGLNIDAPAFGITNETSSDLEFTFVEEATEEKGGEGTAYGWIMLEDFSATVDSSGLTVTAPSISAKLMLGPMFINIVGGDDEIDVATYTSITQVGIATPAAGLAKDYATEDEGYNSFLFGMDTDTFNFDVNVVAESDWIAGTATTSYDSDTDGDGVVDWAEAANVGTLTTTTTADAQNVLPGFVFALGFGVTPGDLTIGLDASMGLNMGGAVGVLNASNPLVAGLDFGYDVALGDMTLTPELGVDFQMVSTPLPVIGLEVGGGVKLTWAGLGTSAGEVYVLNQDGDALDLETTSGVSLGANFILGSAGAVTTTDMNVKLAFYEDGGDAGLLPIVGLEAIAELFSLLSGSLDIGLGLEANADLGVVSPYAGFSMRNTASVMNGLNVWVGTGINVLDNTTFTLDWTSGDLSATPAVAGDVTFATKIAY